jgi:hypothetical protein
MVITQRTARCDGRCHPLTSGLSSSPPPLNLRHKRRPVRSSPAQCSLCPTHTLIRESSATLTCRNAEGRSRFGVHLFHEALSQAGVACLEEDAPRHLRRCTFGAVAAVSETRYIRPAPNQSYERERHCTAAVDVRAKGLRLQAAEPRDDRSSRETKTRRRSVCKMGRARERAREGTRVSERVRVRERK